MWKLRRFQTRLIYACGDRREKFCRRLFSVLCDRLLDRVTILHKLWSRPLACSWGRPSFVVVRGTLWVGCAAAVCGAKRRLWLHRDLLRCTLISKVSDIGL